MKTIVMKFGGASVATPDHFAKIADIIIARKQEGWRIVVVVSAMGDTTDQLISLAKQINPDPPRREYDMLVSVGERVSISLLAMALAAKNQKAVSFTGSQSGIITTPNHSDAEIVDVRPKRLPAHLDAGDVVIVAGFQGMSIEGDITTLGRGGSDTTAVALGAALKAECVEFYKDVEGVYDCDPNLYPDAKHFKTLNYDDALTIVEKGCDILHSRCIEFAKANDLPLIVRSFLEESEGTLISQKDKMKV